MKASKKTAKQNTDVLSKHDRTQIGILSALAAHTTPTFQVKIGERTVAERVEQVKKFKAFARVFVKKNPRLARRPSLQNTLRRAGIRIAA